MTPNKILLLSLLLFPLCAGAQFGLGKKREERANIVNTPTTGDYTLQDPEYRYSMRLMDGYPDEKSAWIVYSDRDNNITYQNPGNEKQPLASLKFMQACFVIDEKDDYVALAEYVPRVNMSKSKKTLENPKYLGWVNKSTLLLWNRALKDRVTNCYVKTITAFGTQRVFDVLQHHVEGDSLITFANPFLNQRAGKCGMENIFYIYKESVLGNEYLVGPDPGFLPEDATQAGMGWISKDLVRIWGTKGFITLNPELAAILPFYQYAPIVKGGRLEQEPVTILQSPYTTPKSDLEKLYPILRYTTREGRAAISSSFLEDALDRGKNRIYNISGDLISNEDIESFNAKSSTLNIVLVVSAGRKNGQYINNLQGVLETGGWQRAARNNFKEVNVGAVIYKDYGPNCDNAVTPLTNDERIVDEFLSEQRKADNDGCDDNSYYQGMYGGIVKAAKMLHDHNGESNIILVYGSGSDETPRKGEAIRSIQSVGARLLFFQTHNIPNEPAYINFVGDAKELISKSSENITELKKRIIVPNTYPNILNGVGFTNDSTGRIQQLDYPRRAITQGYLMFPHDGENMPAMYLATYLDSLITSIATDNRIIGTALRSAVAQSGSGNTRIRKEFAYRFPKYTQERIPLEFLKSNTLRDQSFLIPAWMLLYGDGAAQPGLSSGVLLNEREYTEFANQLAMLGGTGSYDSKDAIVKQITNAIDKTATAQNIKPDKAAGELTFAEALGFVSGYYPVDPVWGSLTLNDYRSLNKISKDIGKAFLEECRSKAVWLHDHNNNADLQLRNNGRIYYLINAAYLPVNPVIGGSLPENRAVIVAPSVPAKANENNTGRSRSDDIGSVINDYSSNPSQAQTPADATLKKGTEDIVKTKTVIKKGKVTDFTPGPEKQVSNSAPARTGNIDRLGEDLNAAPGRENSTASKNSNKESSKADTINYRKRIAAQETQEDRKKEQRAKSNVNLEQDLKGLPQDTDKEKGREEETAQLKAPKERRQKTALQNNTIDFDKDLNDLQGKALQSRTAPAEPKPLTAPGVNIKKGNTGSAGMMQEELDKARQQPKESTSKAPADTINYRNRISGQKTEEKKEAKREEKKPEQQKSKSYSDVDNDLKQLQQQKGDNPANDKVSQGNEKLAAPKVRLKTGNTPAAASGAAKPGDDLNTLLRDLDNTSTDKKKGSGEETDPGKKKNAAGDQ